MNRNIPMRNHPGYWAFLVQRVSGVLLALFLPFHFWALGQAIHGAKALNGFLAWTDQPLVKIGEFILVLLLAAHFTGGLRVLAIEFFAWRDWQKSAVALSFGLSTLIGLAFLLNVF